MNTIGILLHVYNLGCKDWEELVWGDPADNQLGAGTKLLELLLSEPVTSDVTTILCDGPSCRDGLSEGSFTKKFLMDNISKLSRFPRMKRRLDAQTAEEAAVFHQRLESVQIVARIKNTFDEIRQAAKIFKEIGAEKVIHVAAASHAPRCIQLQSVAREQGLIPRNQQWFTVASDIPFAGTSANDTVVIEVPHRADDPLVGYEPTLASVIKPYFSLSGGQQKQFIHDAERAMAELRLQGANGFSEENRPSVPDAV